MQMKRYWTKRTTGRLLIRSHCAAYLVILLCGRECGRMSRGQSQMRTCSAKTALGRCNNRSHDSTNIFDVDISTIDVIIIDSPESSNRKSRSSKNANRKHFPTVICIEENDDDDIRYRRVDHYATSSKTFHPSSSNSYAFEDFDGDECQVLNRKGEGRKRYSKRIFGTLSSEYTTSKIDSSKRGISDTGDTEGDCSDCEIMDGSSVNIREEWEKAALKKKTEKRHADSREGIDAFGFHNSVSSCETSEVANLNGTSCDAYAVQNKGEAQSGANTPVDRTDVLVSAPHISNGFMERHSFKFKMDSFEVSDHTVGEGSDETFDSKNKNEPLSGKTSPHSCHSQPDVSFGREAMDNSCSQDELLRSHLSHDMWMQRGSHSQINEVCSMDNEDNERASFSTIELRDKPQCEDMQRYENPSPCNIPCSSLNVPGPQTGNVTEVAEDSSIFQPQDECASLEPTNCLNERQTDMLHTRHVFQGSMGNIREDMNPVMILQSDVKNKDMMSDNKNDIIGKREKLKESEEYKRAEEEEWASRKQELLIQSEEAQRLRRRRKREKAESLRLLDMEKRQKQRLEEIRDSQKRDEDTINLKEQIRAEIQKELGKVEMKYRDMASLLRGLGINVCGGLYPLPHEVNAAYKQALLRFHPDRASRADIRQQVEAEEKFKLISRLKEKLLPVAH